jgi:xylulose-5-phosphate/fructose-6-phosphate phosphoketolase
VQQINVIVAGKTQEPRWLTPELAQKQLHAGIMTWDFASDDDPDLVLAGIGDYTTKEIMAAVDIVKTERADMRLRVVNISSLTSCGLGQGGKCVTPEEFDRQFTADKPVICNFTGYPETLKAILFDYIDNPKRFSVHGYIESGSTTTPFDMHVRNTTSRYHLAIEAFEKLAFLGKLQHEEAGMLIGKYRQKIEDNTAYIKEHGTDIPEIDAWAWNR